MTAIDVACPKCAAQPGEWCIATMPGYEIELHNLHASRIEAAAFINGAANDKPLSTEAFNKAVEDSDLI